MHLRGKCNSGSNICSERHVKALAYGAAAVMIGRPTAWGHHTLRSGPKKGRLGTGPFVKRGCVIMQRLPWRQEEQGQKLQQWELPEPERVPARVE